MRSRPAGGVDKRPPLSRPTRYVPADGAQTGEWCFMVARSKSFARPRATRKHVFVLAALGVALAACNKEPAPDAAGTATSATAAAAVAAPPPAVSEAVAAMS